MAAGAPLLSCPHRAALQLLTPCACVDVVNVNNPGCKIVNACDNSDDHDVLDRGVCHVRQRYVSAKRAHGSAVPAPDQSHSDQNHARHMSL